MVIVHQSTKLCKGCGEPKSLDDFTKDTSRKDGLAYLCKVCNRERLRPIMRKIMAGRKEQKRVANQKFYLKSLYHMTIDEYNSILLAQGSKCAICGKAKSDAKLFCVDHNHSTGNIRGILCHNCNLILGHAKDDVGVLYKAIEYLKGG